jgi:CMP-N-acetylneuraminic acid synthetase
MYKGKRIIAIIPARGGSKRLPRKNILPLAGKPLIAYTIEQSLASKYVDRTIVSTEDPAIAEVSLRYKAEVIDRPIELATDKATTLSVLKHVLEKIREEGDNPDIIVLLQPTTPLRKEELIDDAIVKLVETGSNAVVSVCELHIGKEWILEIKDCKLDFLIKRNKDTKSTKSSENDTNLKTRTQDQKKAYILNGAIYAYKSKIVEESKIYNMDDDFIPLIMDKASSIDIDNKDDLELAEFYINRTCRKDKI